MNYILVQLITLIALCFLGKKSYRKFRSLKCIRNSLLMKIKLCLVGILCKMCMWILLVGNYTDLLNKFSLSTEVTTLVDYISILIKR